MVSKIFTEREIEVINKKLKGKKLNQTDSNYIYRFIRPKLKEILTIDAKSILDKMEYNQKIESIEKKIKKIVIEYVEDVYSITLFGSAIQNNYKDYRDIDILIITKKKIYPKIKAKYSKIKELKSILQKQKINADIQIYDKKTIEENYPHSPTLIYQLKDSKAIYGKLKLPDKIQLHNIDLKMKLDWSNIDGLQPLGEDIYKALRNVILVRLLLNKIVDNKRLKESLDDEVGKNLIEKLKNNQESIIEKRLALNFLKELSEKTRSELKGDLWAKIGQ
jgi:predicted nucleotidyltransferase